MKKKDLEQLKAKTVKELTQALREEKEKLFGLKVDNMRKKLENTSSLAQSRGVIARIQTFIREKEVQIHG